MKNWIISLLLGGFLMASGQTKPAKYFRNPIIPGFAPDPSICRVGDDYYLVVSSFEYFPGVPIYHSRDLINWKLISHVLNRPSQLDLDKAKSTAGIYAPTIRYHNGTFYMITTLILPDVKGKNKGNFIVTAKDPVGPWSDPHWIDNAPGIDPSLFFDDDGKAYYCGNRDPEKSLFWAHKYIWTQELDLNTFQLKGEMSILDAEPYNRSGVIGNVVAMEAPHIYKKDGLYYLITAHGGTGLTHAESIWKSESPMGPWTINPDNPILQHREEYLNKSGINCTGHAELIQTQKGEWYMALLGVRSYDGNKSSLGRETFLTPVDWSGEWPVVNPNGNHDRVEFMMKAPDLPVSDTINHYYFEDKFESDQLNPHWAMVRTPRSKWWNLKNNQLSLTLRPDTFEEFAQPSFLGKRLFDHSVEVTTKLTFNPQGSNECAGLAMMRGHQPDWTLVIENLNGNRVVSAYEGATRLANVTIPKGSTTIKMEIKDHKLRFFVQQKKSWKQIYESITYELDFPPAGRFTGAFSGLYASSRGGKEGNQASFDFFEMKLLKK